MPDVAQPPEQLEKLHPKPVEKGELQKKVADAPPPSSKATPEIEGDDQAVKRNLEQSPVSDRIDAERRVMDAARQGIEETPGHAIQQEGRAGERASMESLQGAGEKVDDLNRYQESFPLLDVATDQRLQSVKVKSVDRPPDDGVYDRYRYDFEKLLDNQRAEQAADALQKHGARLPSELGNNPSRERLASYIRDKSELAIPDDHVDGVRQNVADMARQVPERYGLQTGSPTLEQDVQMLTERIKPIGLTSSEISRMRHQT